MTIARRHAYWRLGKKSPKLCGNSDVGMEPVGDAAGPGDNALQSAAIKANFVSLQVIGS